MTVREDNTASNLKSTTSKKTYLAPTLRALGPVKQTTFGTKVSGSTTDGDKTFKS